MKFAANSAYHDLASPKQHISLKIFEKKMAYIKGIVVFKPKGLRIVERNSRNSHKALGTYSKVIMGS